ncbi:type IV secretory system conjugative DNA transfer family protein [Streptomyces sp. NPDC002328]|uniref:type IV secretory system conjugative DNA transfer family protein n=1 Tax=Streptomyces sp. NPDC002328 TaxID=3364642 RepID=UPI00368FC4CE
MILIWLPWRRPGPTDFRDFRDAEGTVFLLGKDSEVNSVAPLTTAITEDLLDLVEAHAIASPTGRLEPPLLAALDEAPNIAPIPSLRQRVADGRGRGITVIYGLQGWASARARFGEDTANELASFTDHVVVFGGAKDPVFLKDMSDVCGQVERERTTARRPSDALPARVLAPTGSRWSRRITGHEA